MSRDSSAKYFQINKKRIQLKTHEKYQSLSKKEKEKKKRVRKRYKSLVENGRQKLVVYRENIIMTKNTLL